MSSPLIDAAKRLKQGFEKYVSKIPTPGYSKKVDTSWHDKAVADANESYRKKGVAPKTAPKKKAKPVKKTATKRYGK